MVAKTGLRRDASARSVESTKNKTKSKHSNEEIIPMRKSSIITNGTRLSGKSITEDEQSISLRPIQQEQPNTMENHSTSRINNKQGKHVLFLDKPLKNKGTSNQYTLSDRALPKKEPAHSINLVLGSREGVGSHFVDSKQMSTDKMSPNLNSSSRV